MAKLRAFYPNVMELIREEKTLRNNNKNVALNIKEKSKLTLFENFYEDILGDKVFWRRIKYYGINNSSCWKGRWVKWR